MLYDLTTHNPDKFFIKHEAKIEKISKKEIFLTEYKVSLIVELKRFNNLIVISTSFKNLEEDIKILKVVLKIFYRSDHNNISNIVQSRYLRIKPMTENDAFRIGFIKPTNQKINIEFNVYDALNQLLYGIDFEINDAEKNNL